MKRPSLHLETTRIFALVAPLVLISLPGWAQEFSWVGARSAAMGGTGVALADDALAVHFNPAGLAVRPHPDTVVTGGATARDRQDLLTQLEQLGDVDEDALAAGDPQATALARQAIENLARDDSGLDGAATGGVFLTQRGAGLSAQGLGWVAARPYPDLVRLEPGDDPDTGIANNQTRVEIRGLELQELVLSYSYSVIPGLVAVGANGKYIRGKSYDYQPHVYDLDETGRLDFLLDGLERNSTGSDQFSWDLGVMVTPLDSIRAGATVRYANEPEFDLHGGGVIRVERQVRAGVAFSTDGFQRNALTVDVDLTPSTPPLSDRPTRYSGVGGVLWWRTLAIRAGARTDLEAPGTPVTPTLGFGFGNSRLRLDVGAAWREDRDADVAVALRWTAPN